MSSSLSISKLVWVSLKPLLKISLPSLVGAYLLKSGKIDNEGLKVAARIQIYGALPCLMFSNIVPSISAENSASIGVCICFGLFYMVVSFFLAKILERFVYVPKKFKSGFLVAAVWSNWGNLPISVIQSLTSDPPFGNPIDEVLGVAYASFFVLVYNITMFAGPGLILIQQDFMGQNYPSNLIQSRFRRRSSTAISQCSSTISFEPEDSLEDNNHSQNSCNLNQGETQPLLAPDESSEECSSFRKGLKHFFSNLLSPLSQVLLLSTFIAVVPWLKALFVEVTNHKSITAPDGKPVFSVIVDSTRYLGAAAIPLSLIITGASFANMALPRNSWRALPAGAIFGLVFIKLFILPIIGIFAVLVVDRTTRIFEGKESKILKMICIYYSSTVTSTNQISLSALAASEFNKEGNVDLLCAFVIVQYILYPIVGTTIIMIGIKMVI